MTDLDNGHNDTQVIAQDGVAAATGAAGTVGLTNVQPPDPDPNVVGYTILLNQPNRTTPILVPVTRFDTGPACFVTGTEIVTPAGPVAVEDIVAGHLVLTRDYGVQPVRWAGSQTMSGTDCFAPLCVSVQMGRLSARV